MPKILDQDSPLLRRSKKPSNCGPRLWNGRLWSLWSVFVGNICRLVEHCGTRHFRVPYLPSFQPIFFRYHNVKVPPLDSSPIGYRRSVPRSFADGAFDVVLNVSDSTQLGSAPMRRGMEGWRISGHVADLSRNCIWEHWHLQKRVV